MPDLVLHVVRQVRQRVALRGAALGVISSSRPVNDTGWNDRKLIFFGLSSANWMIAADLLVVDAVDDRR